MSALDRKLVRDILQMKGQVLAICLVIACGVATFVMSLSALDALQNTQEKYYDRYRFAHVFATLKRAPLSLASRIQAIPGVSAVQTRVVRDVTLDVAGLNEPAVGRLISIPELRPPRLNAIYLRRGRMIEPGRSLEVLVSEGFADAHELNPGDKVIAIINGRKRDLKIVGVALSPEYVYQIRPGDLVPDDRRFGIFWMSRTALEAAFDMEGAFNDVTLSLMPGAVEEEVIARLDYLTEPYGGLGAYGRDDQVSNRFLSDEIKQLQTMGMLVPTIFLGVAAFLLNVVLSRIVSLQREQIAALKAFGYSNLAVGIHYQKLVLLVVIVGVILGTAMGAWLGYRVTQLYTKFYRFPLLEFQLPYRVVVLSLLISGGAATLGTINVIRRAVRLPPAEAMRPEPPSSFRPMLLERIGLTFILSPAMRMVLRNIERRPVKSFFSAFGMGLAIAILILGRFSADALDYLMEVTFDIAQQHDVSITFVEPTSARALYDVEHLPGVILAEPYRMVPARLQFGHRSKRAAITGLPPHPHLNRLIDSELQPIPIPPGGIVLNEKLAQLLGIRLGEMLTVHVLEGERPTRTIPVTGIAREFLGISAYMDIDALNRFMREGPTISGAYLATDQRYAEKLYYELKQTPRIAGVTVKDAAIRSFREIIAENMLQMQVFNVIFAMVIAFGVVYNTARIALSERARELASLRVLGFTRAEISAILLGELAILTLAALPLGLALGYGMARSIALSLNTEMYRIPFVIEPATYAFAVTVALVAAVLSGLIVRRRLDHLDLIAVLKTRE